MANDLFGRPSYDAPPARQPPLFGARHWFECGYMDCCFGKWNGYEAAKTGFYHEYNVGFEAAERDRREKRNLDPARAWREAVVVGNVFES